MAIVSSGAMGVLVECAKREALPQSIRTSAIGAIRLCTKSAKAREVLSFLDASEFVM